MDLTRSNPLRERFASLFWFTGRTVDRALLEQVETYCLFIGYARSGHSMVGALLNAHRHAVIAHELNLLWYVRLGLSEERLLTLMLRREEWFASRGRKWFDYDYELPGQGTFEQLRVVGDKKGSHTTRHLTDDPRLLDRLHQRLSRPLKFVHVLRNPFDNISTIYRRRKADTTLRHALEKYMARVVANTALIERVGAENVHVVRLEDLIAAPKPTVAGMCAFFDLDAPDHYLDACAKVVFPAPRKTRAAVEWTPDLVRELQDRLAPYPLFAGYSFEE
jgi:hypothetical protein